MQKVLLVFLFISFKCFAQEPQRKALMGMQGRAVSSGIVADSIIPNGTWAAINIQKGDTILELNGQQLSSMQAYGKTAAEIRTGDEVRVRYIRNNKKMFAKGKAVMRPYETSDIADIRYDWVKFRSGALRAIARKPKGKIHCPAILLIPGYGCGSIENYAGSYNGKLMNEWIKAGYAVVTIEKSGMGDSYGCVPCSEADLVTDIESFDAGYRYMKSLPFVDTTQLVIWGHSMGGVIAPEVAKKHHPAAVMVFGATFRPWNEFLPEMHRIQKPLLEQQTYVQTEAFMRTIQKIYYEFFVLGKTPAQLYVIPEYKELVASELNYKEGSNDMWGRHWRFWQQIDSLNLAADWQSLNCKVLIVHGETDYEKCSRVEPMLMQKAVNEVHPGNATLIVIPQLDHFMMKSATWEEARDNFKAQQYNKGNFNSAIAEETIKWLRENIH
ncbi:MAG: alpha/beta fold hydrolase [Bacteroidetes bacterium]|nr:alpha/beta fold hydrolase [Bacteroidota bacterium]